MYNSKEGEPKFRVKGTTALDRAEKVVVFGGGSFGTAMGAALAKQKEDLQITLLLRDPSICKEINHEHVNYRYLKVCHSGLHIRRQVLNVSSMRASWFTYL